MIDVCIYKTDHEILGVINNLVRILMIFFTYSLVFTLIYINSKKNRGQWPILLGISYLALYIFFLFVCTLSLYIQDEREIIKPWRKRIDQEEECRE